MANRQKNKHRVKRNLLGGGRPNNGEDVPFEARQVSYGRVRIFIALRISHAPHCRIFMINRSFG